MGAGGFGLVCRARHRTLHRAVALKLFPLGEETDPGVQEALREARSLARLEHPNIVVVHGVGEGELVAATPMRCAYVEMQLVQGDTLRAWAEQGRAASEIVARLLDAGRALAYAHQRGLLHRDFKPENVMVDQAGTVRVIDFGLALAMETESADGLADRVTTTGSVRGTPGYIAPEAALGQVQPASDQFALAVAVQELLTGRHPLMAADAPSGPHPTDGPAMFERLGPAVDRAVQLRPEARFPSVDAFCDAVEHLARPPRARPRWPWLLPIGAAGLGAFVWGSSPEPRPVAAVVEASPPPTAASTDVASPVPDLPVPAPKTPAEPRPVVAPGERYCGELQAWAGVWNVGARTMWTEFAYQLAWRSEFQLDLTVAEDCAVTMRAAKYPEPRETDPRGEPLWVDVSTEALADADGTWRLEFDLAFEGDTDTYGKPEAYRVVAVLGRDEGTPFLRAVADKRSRGALVRSAVWDGRRGLAPSTSRVRVEGLPCAAACQLQCGGRNSQAACRRRECVPDAEVPGDICGPNSFDFKPPLRAAAARRRISEGDSPLQASLEKGSRKRLIPQCSRNARRLVGGWDVWRNDETGTSSRVHVVVDADACQLSGSATNPDGDAVAVTGEVTPAGTWTLAPAEPMPWFPSTFVLVGTAEGTPAFGVDVAQSGSSLRARRSEAP